MNDGKEINNNLSERLRAFRDVLGISSNALSEIIFLSQPTLSRIEKGKTNILYENIQILSDAFGITPIQFQDSKFPIPSRKILIKNLKVYTKKNNRDIDINRLLEKPKTAYFLDKIIDTDFMTEYRTVSEIRVEAKKEFDKDLVSGQISKLLIQRIKDGKVERTKLADSNRDYQYRRTEL